MAVSARLAPRNADRKCQGQPIAAPTIPDRHGARMDENQLVRIDPPQAQVPHLVVPEDVDLLEAFLAGRRPTSRLTSA
jgi:hypothetical protein